MGTKIPYRVGDMEPEISKGRAPQREPSVFSISRVIPSFQGGALESKAPHRQGTLEHIFPHAPLSCLAIQFYHVFSDLSDKIVLYQLTMVYTKYDVKG